MIVGMPQVSEEIIPGWYYYLEEMDAIVLATSRTTGKLYLPMPVERERFFRLLLDTVEFSLKHKVICYHKTGISHITMDGDPQLQQHIEAIGTKITRNYPPALRLLFWLYF